MGFSSVGIWSHRASPCQTVVLLLGKPSGGEYDPSHSSRGVKWVYTAMQSANFTTANRGVEASSGKYITKSLKSFQLWLLREVVPAGRERRSDAETYSHAWTALSMITFSVWKLALQSKLISFSGKLGCSLTIHSLHLLKEILLSLLASSQHSFVSFKLHMGSAGFLAHWSNVFITQCVGWQSNTCIVCSMQACADVQIILTHCIPGCIFIELEEIWH